MTASNDLTTAYGLMVRHLAGEPPPSLPQPAGRRYRRLTDGDGTDPVADEWDAQQSRTRPAVPSNSPNSSSMYTHVGMRRVPVRAKITDAKGARDSASAVLGK